MQYKNRIDKSIQIISKYRKGYMPHLSNLYTGLTHPPGKETGVRTYKEISDNADER
jgi:hypothetical protein